MIGGATGRRERRCGPESEKCSQTHLKRKILSGFCEVEGNRLCKPEEFGGAKAWLRRVGGAQVLACSFRRRLQAEGCICNNTELSPTYKGLLETNSQRT